MPRQLLALVFYSDTLDGAFRGRDWLPRFAPARAVFFSAADRCARPGCHVGQKLSPRYLCPREHVFHPPRFDFGIVILHAGGASGGAARFS
jgi:hypothetical protein